MAKGDDTSVHPQRPVKNVIRSLEVGVSGGLRPTRKLDRRERCTVIVHDADGEVIASGEGTIGNIGFKDKVKDGYLFVTRICKVKLD